MVTRDDLIAYLLHRLPDEARTTVAEQSLADPDLHEQLQMAEAELLDAYARDEASPDDRQAIETHLLASAYQRDKLAFAEALQIALPSRSSTAAAPAHPIVAHRGRRPAWTTWAAAAAIVVLAGGLFWLSRENAALRERVAVRPPVPAPPQARVEPTTVAGGIAVIPLAANDLRGGGAAVPTVRVPEGASVVRFDLDLEVDDQNDAYTITLTSDDRLAWREEPVRRASNVAAPVVAFLVPATVLTPGGYEISVSAGGRPVAYFPIHVAIP